jgi:predicted TIM-barrel fold metal-dependent hydrolase
MPKLVSVFGANRIAWGSNFPSTPGTVKEILTTSQEACRALSDSDREWIFAKTAQSLYPALKD